MKSLSAALAASSLILASGSAVASPASKLSIASNLRSSAAAGDESELMDSGFIGFAIVFGAGAAVGALVYSLLKGKDDTPASP